MTVDAKLLKAVQDAGWFIVRANETTVTGACRRAGCGLKATFSAGRGIPEADNEEKNTHVQAITDFEDARKYLRNRRISLGLTIAEVEEIAGMTPDYLAKFEKDGPSKYPNAITYIQWAQALGCHAAITPGRLTGLGLRTIAQTREQAAARANMNEYLAKKRQVLSE